MLISFGHGQRTQLSSTTINKWWSFFLLAFVSIVMGLFSGCSSTGDVVCSIPKDQASLVTEDALTLVEFQQLPVESRRQRRLRADVFLQQAKKSDRSSMLVMGLTNAAGLSPDNQGTWLELARIWRWVGDYSQVESCLENAVAALEYLDDGKGYSPEEIMNIQRSISLEQALLMAWLHYDRGEWDLGFRWSNKANKIESGSAAVRQIRGLLAASAGKPARALGIVESIEHIDAHNTDATWILAALDRSRHKWGAAYDLFGGIKPSGEHVAEFYRDMGLVAEYIGSWGDARRWYEKSAASLPVDDDTCLTKRSALRLDTGSEEVIMPIWLASERYYVTGSRSAYTSLALAKFEMAADPDERDFWAGQVVNATGILLRWGIDRSFAYRARGLVFLNNGKIAWGWRDLRRAAKIFADQGVKDGRIEAEFGHACLMDEDLSGALPHLRASIGIDPGSAPVWGDLGLTLVKLGAGEEAERAFTMALGLDPLLATAWYNRGLIYLHRKEWDLAEKDLTAAADLAPDNQDVASLLQKLKQRNTP